MVCLDRVVLSNTCMVFVVDGTKQASSSEIQYLAMPCEY